MAGFSLCNPLRPRFSAGKPAPGWTVSAIGTDLWKKRGYSSAVAARQPRSCLASFLQHSHETFWQMARGYAKMRNFAVSGILPTSISFWKQKMKNEKKKKKKKSEVTFSPFQNLVYRQSFFFLFFSFFHMCLLAIQTCWVWISFSFEFALIPVVFWVLLRFLEEAAWIDLRENHKACNIPLFHSNICVLQKQCYSTPQLEWVGCES